MRITMVHMIHFLVILLQACFYHSWSIGGTPQVFRPRGVSLAMEALYMPSKAFKCLDGSASFPFRYVNDDYCDCPDGSDEPGTSACPNGKFHCVNVGYISEDIPSSRVNDGICDCCDGSDEYSTDAGCINLCVDLGKKAKEVAAEQQRHHEKGQQLWKEYSIRGKQMKQANIAKLEKLQVAVEVAEKAKKEMEEIKKKAEDNERAAISQYNALKELERQREADKRKAEEVFHDLDLNKDGMVTISEVRQNQIFDVGRDGSVSGDEAKLFLNMKETVGLHEFLDTGWAIMKPLYMMNRTLLPILPLDENSDREREYSDSEHVSSDKEDSRLRGDSEDDGDSLLTPQFVDSSLSTTEKSEEIVYDDQTQEVIDLTNRIRQECEEAADKLSAVQNDIQEIRTNIETDFGADEQFAVLKGQCFEFDDAEYIYKFCPFDRASQIPKTEGVEIDLGHWGYWIGPNDNKYLKMKYDNGQSCWNGPARMTIVMLSCGVINKVFSASEPSRCEYALEFSTPAMCFAHKYQYAEL